jgi:hypothetical protein
MLMQSLKPDAIADYETWAGVGVMLSELTPTARKFFEGCKNPQAEMVSVLNQFAEGATELEAYSKRLRSSKSKRA